MSEILREYDPSRDYDAVLRIMREVGWVSGDQVEAHRIYVSACRGHVAEIDGEAECFTATSPATMRYLDEDLPISCVTAVTTSRIARKQGLAGRMAARAVAAAAAEGALVSALGMFEQGFYNQIGFGTGSYEHSIAFDPAQLTVSVKARPPRRITADDWEQAHAARLTRWRRHGGCYLNSPLVTRSLMLAESDSFGLGYRDGPNGTISHYLWLHAKGSEGPYHADLIVFQTREQFLELMAVLKSLGDQVRLIKMEEPAAIQLQDLIRQPIKQRQVSEGAKFQAGIRALAYWQMRICDLPGCLAHTRLPGGEVRFNLRLTDPIERFLDPSSAWRGIGGEYVVTFGPVSHAERGSDSALPTLSASAGAFTRLWLGVRPATSLAITDDLSGPADLLERLDYVLRLPVPHPEWDF